MRAVTSILIFCISNHLLAQDFAQVDKGLVRKDYQGFSLIDRDTISEIAHRKKRILFNQKFIDSTGLSFSSLLTSNSRIFGYRYLEKDFNKGKPEHSLYEILRSGVVKLVWHSNDIITYQTPNAIFLKKKILPRPDDDRLTHFYERNFYKIDFSNFDRPRLYDIDAFMKVSVDDGNDLIGIYHVSKSMVIATIAYCLGGCTNYKYYRVDLDSGEMTKLNLNLKEPDNEFYAVWFRDHNSSGFLVEVDNYSGPSANGGYFIWDKDFNETSRALPQNQRVVGYNYVEGDVVSANIKSKLDDNTGVIVKSRFSIELQRSLYRVYSNESLIIADLEGCTSHELDIIRNVVFARHNYKFKNEFYQAYFNSYDFYSSREKKSSRIDDVSNLLTDIDKSNLKLIETYAKKK